MYVPRLHELPCRMPKHSYHAPYITIVTLKLHHTASFYISIGFLLTTSTAVVSKSDMYDEQVITEHLSFDVPYEPTNHISPWTKADINDVIKMPYENLYLSYMDLLLYDHNHFVDVYYFNC